MKVKKGKGEGFSRVEFTNKTWLVSVFLILSIPGVSGLFEDSKEREQWERRELAGFPIISDLYLRPVKYFGALDLYLNDHFGLARFLNKLNRKGLFYAFNTTPSKNISIGRDGFIYLNSHSKKDKNMVFKYYCNERQYDEAYFVNTASSIKVVEENFTRRGYRFFFGLAPSKPVIYPYNLPESVPKKLKDACSNASQSDFGTVKMIVGLQETGSKIYYPYSLFQGRQHEKYFYPKENFHWKGKSAHLFAGGLLRSLGIQVTKNYHDGAFLKEDQSDLSNFLGFSLPVKVWSYPYNDFGVKHMPVLPGPTEKYYERVNDYSYYRTNSPLSDRKAIILSDSFGYNAVSHLAPGYTEVLHINISNLQEPEKRSFYVDYIDNYKPDDVIFLFHDAGIRGIEDVSRVLSSS